MNVSLSAVEMLTLAHPRLIRSWNWSADSPVPPCRAIGMPVASTRAVTRSWSSVGDALYRPCALPMAGAKQSTPVRSMKSTATSRLCCAETSSDPTPSSTPWIPSISPSTCAPTCLASATTSMVCARFSATSSSWASNSTEFQPPARQSLITDRSGQWSRWRTTGTSTSRTSAVKMAKSCSRPYCRTVFTDVCRITGDRSATAADSTASMLRSLRMLMAGTPYLASKARPMVSFNVTTGKIVPLDLVGVASPSGTSQHPTSVRRGWGHKTVDPTGRYDPVRP